MASALTWEGARDYLASSGQLTTRCTSLVELASALQDGNILCDLANTIRAGAIQRVHLHPQHQFMVFANINAFRSACLNFFDVAAPDIFEPEELYHASNFERVILTISTVSHSALSKRRGLRAFPDKPQRQPRVDETNQSLYESLEEIVEAGNLARLRARHAGGRSRPKRISMSLETSTDDYADDDSDDDDVLDYEDCDMVFPGSSVSAEDVYETIVRSRAKSKKARTPASKSRNFDKKGMHIFDELLDTEQNYVSALQLIETHFRIPMCRKAKELQVTGADITSVFLNVDQLHKIHQKFVRELESSPGVGRVVLHHKKDFLKYAEYCAGLPSALAHLETLSKGSGLQRFLKTAQQESKQRFELKDLLSLPMQRILKYPLLVKDLIKHTDKSEGLSTALRSLQDLAKYINEVKRDCDNIAVIDELQASLKDYNVGSTDVVPLTTYGRYILDGDLKLKAEYESKAVRRYVFLFQKAFIICKPKASSHHFLYTMNIRDFQFEDEWIRGKNTGIKLSSRLPSAIALNCTMIFKSEAVKMEWLHAMYDAKQSLSPEIPKGVENTHHYELTTFEEPTSCASCGFLLWGKLNQGFQCTGCKVALHKACINNYSKSCPEKNPARTASVSQHSFRQPQPSVICADDQMLTLKPARRGRASASEGLCPIQPRLQAAQVKAPAPAAQPKPQLSEVYVAIYDYVDHHDRSVGDLAFHAGDEIIVTEKTSQNWWTGRLRDGSKGVVPATFLMPKSDAPQRHKSVATSVARSQTFSHAQDSPRRPEHKPNEAPPTVESGYGNKGVDPVMVTNTYSNEDSHVQATTAQTPDKDGHFYVNLNRRTASVIHHGTKDHNKTWFMGVQSRDDADERLARAPDGAFLVRESTRRPGEYSLSIKFKIVKHIKVFEDKGFVHISLKKRFSSIPDMVEFYQTNPLTEHFPQLQTKMLHPMGKTQFPRSQAEVDLGRAVAKYDFRSETPDELDFVRGDMITLLAVDGCGEGWWKGRLNGQTGVFPSSYVERRG